MGLTPNDFNVGDRIIGGSSSYSGVVIKKFKSCQGDIRILVECDNNGWMVLGTIDSHYKHEPLGFQVGDFVKCIDKNIPYNMSLEVGVINHIWVNSHDSGVRIMVEFPKYVGIFGPPDAQYVMGGHDALKVIARS